MAVAPQSPDGRHTHNRPHVAVLASPGMGHVTPLLQLAKRLVVDHGFKVTFLSMTTDAPPAQIQLLNSPTLPPDLHVIHLPHVDLSKLLTAATGLSLRIVHVVRQTLKTLPSILTTLNSPSPLKSLIVDPFCIEALEIAADHSIPTYAFLTSSASFLAVAMYFPKLAADVSGDYSKIGERVFVPGCNPLLLDDLIPGVLIPEVLPLCNRLPLVKGIFVNTWEELEPVTLGAVRQNPFFLALPAPPVYPIGPLTKTDEPVASTAVSTKMLTWMDMQPSDSVVYVSFGSGGTLSFEQMTELARGLELSQKRFVWVARVPSEGNASGNFFKAGDDADDPASFLPDGFLDRTRGRGLVTVSWAPQMSILSHRAVAGFVTHCGWNSVLESVVNGVGMIAWPLYAEQSMNARMLVDMGVAVWPKAGEKGVVGRCEVEAAVRTVVGGEEGKRIRRRAREVQANALKALAIGSANGSLADLADMWKAGSTV